MQPTASANNWPFTGRQRQVEAFAAAQADAECVGVVAIGEAGTGTTRFVQECADRAEMAGTTVLRVWATAASSTTALAALLPMLPTDVVAPGPADLPEVLRRARDHFGGGDPVMLTVDQLHHLDEASATVVDHLLQAGIAFLLGSAMSGASATESVAGLWTSGRVRRIDLPPLDRETVETLLHRALGGAVDGEAAADLWAASQGNPMLLSELVDSALANGQLLSVDGVWRSNGPLTVAGRSAEIIERRLLDLGDEAVAGLEVVLVNQPIGLVDLEALVPSAVLEALETARFIVVRTDRRRTEALIAQPGVIAVATRRLTSLRARRLATDAADRVERHGARRSDDVLRIARWRLDADGSAHPDILLGAARVARGAHDFATVERMAAAAEREGAGASATQLLGEALYELGRFVEAEAKLSAPPIAPIDDDERHLLATTRTTNLFWGLADPAGATAALDAALATVSSPSVRRAMQTQHGSITFFSGFPAKALADLPQLDPDDARARVLAAFVRAPALAAAGRTEEAIAIADEAFAEHLALGGMAALAHPGSHMVAKGVALIEAGRLAEAWELGLIGYEVSVAERVPVAKMWFSLHLGRVALLQGAAVRAARWFREQVVHARTLAHHQPLRLGLAGVAISAGYLGDAATADRAVRELDAFAGGSRLYSVEAARARAWAATAAGRTAEGRAMMLPAAAAAGETGQVAQQITGLYEYVRLGGPPAEVADEMAALAVQTDSGLLLASAQHVGALARRDAAGLVAAADRLEGLGALLFAAEAAIASADAYRRTGEQRSAAAQSNRASALIAACEGARTPALVVTDAVVPLTAREREIAYLVARGLPSRKIAEQLFLSVRTVQNHLQRIYGKLGVSNRSEVAGALPGQEPDA